MKQKGKIKLPITEDTLIDITIYLVGNLAFIVYFFTPLHSFVKSLPNWAQVLFIGTYCFGTIAMLFTPLWIEKFFEYRPEAVRPFYFRKKVRISYRLIYLATLFIPGAFIILIIKHRPNYFDFFLQLPSLIGFLILTTAIAMLVRSQTVLERKLYAKYNFIGFFPSKGMPSQGVVVNEQGIYWDKQALHIPWHNVDMVTAEVTEIHPEDMILNACLHIHYRGGQTFTVTTDYKDYDEVFEGICAAFQLHNAQAQLTELYYEEQSGCCTKLWQRG